tara:strand:- start:66 stop:1109 length:1044 start_codon:yes stop_codon:yes gene_type:complete
MAYITFQPKDNFNTVLYTGNGSTNAITGVGFQPDWVWCKKRNSAQDHGAVDAVRGVTKVLYPNLDSAESTDANSVTAFGTDGFTLGSSGDFNQNSDTYVSWNWKAGGGQGSSNTDGSINTTYTSANTTAGFSISKYTGTGSNATIGHGLGSVPSVVLVKKTSGTGDWIGYFKSLGNTKNARLNETDAADTNSTVWNATDPTSLVFSVGTFGETNGSGDTFVAYCFAEKKGFSKFGSYTGNGNADGTFVYTGFKPAFVMVKRSSGTESWQMTDSVRDKDVSPNFARLVTNASSAESTNTTWAKIEKFSNGFKLGGTDTVSNGSGSTYIYMAFAEEPLVSSNEVPATAR